MAEVWPATLRSPLLNTHQETLNRNEVRFQPELGPPKTRRRGTAAGSISRFAIAMTLAEREDLVEFFEDTTKHGTIEFTMAHPATGDTHQWTFEEPPEIQDMSFSTYRANLSLRRLP